jgi:hypothetical protein
MNRDTVRQSVVVLAVIATIIVNILANALPINNLDTGQISDQFDVYFVPAGYVFSIWGLIYIGLIAFAIYQALPAQRTNPRLRSASGPFIVSSLANIAWIFLWHYQQFALSVLVIFILLGSLILTYLRLGIGKSESDIKTRLFVQLPFQIYLGWATVASIANTTSFLDFIGWNGWGIAPEVWTMVMLAAAVLITFLVVLTRRDTAYPLVIVWAFVGIALKHSGVPLVSTSAWIAAAVVAIIAAGNAFKIIPALRGSTQS